MEHNKISQQINDMVGDNVKLLSQLFPSAVKDGQVDFNALKEELGQFEEVGKEKYELTWSGKQNAKKLAQEDVINRTLNYIKKDSKNPETTENLYIEGDNLEVLKLLRQNYYGAIKMIYIDPPYNTGKDFVYKDNFNMNKTESDIAEGTVSEDNERLQINQKSTNRYHANWLNMMYPRLKVAKDLLTDDGVVFISIDDNEVDNLREICNEIYGNDSFIARFIWDGGRKNDSKRVSASHEYILVYGKNNQNNEENEEDETIWKERKEGIDDIYKVYKKSVITHNENWELVTQELKKWFSMIPENNPTKAHKHYCNADSSGVYFASDLSGPDDGRKSRPRYEVIHPITRKTVPIPSRGWRWEETRMLEELKNDRVHFGNDETSIPNGKVYLRENEWQAPSSVFYKDRRSASNLLKRLFDEKVFDFPKDTNILMKLISYICRGDDIVIDFFSGSASLGEAVMQYNATQNLKVKYVLVQLPDEVAVDSKPYKAGYPTICEIGKERIRRAGERIKKEVEEHNAKLKEGEEAKKVPDIGFKVFRTADTNIKWNTITASDQIDIDTATYTPDLADFILEATDEDVVYEIMLRQNDVSLADTMEILTDIGKRTYLYASSYLVCLETEITEKLVEKLSSIDPLPIKFVFRDSAFKDDIDLKDETFRRLKSLIEKNSGLTKKTYTVEFI